MDDEPINIHWQKIIKYCVTILGFTFHEVMDLTLPQIKLLLSGDEREATQTTMSYEQILKHVEKVRSGILS